VRGQSAVVRRPDEDGEMSPRFGDTLWLVLRGQCRADAPAANDRNGAGPGGGWGHHHQSHLTLGRAIPGTSPSLTYTCKAGTLGWLGVTVGNREAWADGKIGYGYTRECHR